MLESYGFRRLKSDRLLCAAVGVSWKTQNCTKRSACEMWQICMYEALPHPRQTEGGRQSMRGDAACYVERLEEGESFGMWN